MEFHNKITQQAAWDELVYKLSSWKNLAFAYLKSMKDAEPYSEELFNAMKSANSECHMVLDKILKCILTNSASPDNGDIVELLSQEFIKNLFPHQRFSESLDRQLVITPNVCRIGRPQYGSAFLSNDLRSEIKINYETKTNHRIFLFENLNRDPPNSNVPVQSKQLNSSSCCSSTLSPSDDIDFRTFTSYNPTQSGVKNTLQYTDQDQQKYDNRCTNSSVTKHQQQFTSPTNNYHETEHKNRNRSRSRSFNEQRCKSKSTDSLENRHKTHHGNTNRSRSRSCNEQRCKSKSTDSLKKKQESRDRTRKKSRSKSRTKSPKRKENVTKYKHESRDKMRKKSRSKSRTKSPKRKENVTKYKQESRDRMRKKSRSKSRTKSPKRKENVTKYKQESRDRMRKKSRSKSRTRSPKRKENISKNLPLSKRNDHSPFLSKSGFDRIPLTKRNRMKKNKQYRRLQEELYNIKEKMSNHRAAFHTAASSSTCTTATIREIESDSEIEKIQGNVQQALVPVKPYYQNPDEVSKYRPRTSVFIIRPPPPYFMPPRPRLRFPPRPLLRLPPSIVYRPQWMP